MNNPKKLESLHQATFSQDFSKVLGGSLNPPVPIPTGFLTVALTGAYDHTPEGPKDKKC